MKTKSRVSKITVGRLFNLGSYEHIRYELTVEVPLGQSATSALIGVERILSALNPKTYTKSREEIKRKQLYNAEMRKSLRKVGAEEFRRMQGHFEGTPLEYIRRCEASTKKDLRARIHWELSQAKARQLLDDLGGASRFKDAKQDWETDEDF